jgi:hypothetical protein
VLPAIESTFAHLKAKAGTGAGYVVTLTVGLTLAGAVALAHPAGAVAVWLLAGVALLRRVGQVTVPRLVVWPAVALYEARRQMLYER